MSTEEELTEDDPKWVCNALDAPREFPPDPQVYLWGSNHPYSPFTGNALKWDSYVYDDGTTYEGLTRENVPHGKGILTLGYGYGGGIQDCSRGDRYEGEFMAGFAHGLGQYIAADSGELYRGEWSAGKRQGCGVLTDMNPFYKRVAEGVDPQQAWEETKQDIEANEKWGTWHADFFNAGPDDTGKYCGYYEIKGVLQELESVVTRARMFKNKPDGDVTVTTMVDEEGKPIKAWQDPMHYPHQTKFLAPGPMGQCFPIPDDPELKRQMAIVARNWTRIYNMYNFPRETPPGSELEKAEKLWSKLKGKLAKEKKRLDLQEKRRMAVTEAQTAAPAGAKAAAAASAAPAAAADDEDDGGIDDDDLIASVPQDKDRRPGSSSGTAWGSVSLAFRPPRVGPVSMRMRRVAGVIVTNLTHRRQLSRPQRRG